MTTSVIYFIKEKKINNVDSKEGYFLLWKKSFNQKPSRNLKWKPTDIWPKQK